MNLERKIECKSMSYSTSTISDKQHVNIKVFKLVKSCKNRSLKVEDLESKNKKEEI